MITRRVFIVTSAATASSPLAVHAANERDVRLPLKAQPQVRTLFTKPTVDGRLLLFSDGPEKPSKLIKPEALDQQKLKQYAKSTRQFWRALNLWLSESDFLLGRPTAKALVSHWQYASYALSQALVRDADRKRFSGLFESYDLVPGDPVPEAEMVLLVHDWMTSHGPTGPTVWLRKLWAANELRERVVAAALDAFETWEKSTATAADGSRNARLQWQLGFTGFPGKRARLSLAVIRGGQEEALEPESRFEGEEPGLFLEGGIETGIQFLGPLQSLNLDLILLQSRKFNGVESGISYNYIAKPIVPLARSGRNCSRPSRQGSSSS
ncbi:hypothetical protein SuNHUV7_41260 (plasmid) [Pseudoseohaeicola sp. NH-UV-7]|uniref:hypothetical protein n=1 Tax=Sulfitobacter sp. TBRI5 TaxID=2989732 RepID=UPI003A7375DD